MKKLFNILLGVALTMSLATCDDSIPEDAYYTFTGEMVSDYLQTRSDQFSDFIAILQRSGMYGMMATYGTYTCLAPTNNAVQSYLHQRGLQTVDQLGKLECDTIAWNHVIKQAFFTTDLTEGNIPIANMNGRYLTFSCDSDVVNNNNVIYYINKMSRLMVRDDSVENGVVHTLDRVIQPSSQYLPELLSVDTAITLFNKALFLTGLDKQLYDYIDESYSCGEDSVYKGFNVSTGGGTYYTYYVGVRMKRFTAFVETDEVFKANGIESFEDLVDAAKENYNEVYPEDAGLYDDDYTNPKNPLYRFVAYHLLPYYGAYNDWTVYGELKQTCAMTDLIDCTDWFTTLLPHTLMKMSTPSEGLFINRKGVNTRASVEGVKVYSPSEVGKIDQQALNGIYHYINKPLFYSKETRDVVFNERIRINAVTMSPEFMNCGARGNTENATGFKVIEGWDFHGRTPSLTLRKRWSWMATYADCIDLVGQFDVTFKLPPVPRQETYEVRFAYGCGGMRGVVQIYFGTKDNMQPAGIPIDLRIWGADPTIGWVADVDGDPEANRAIDKGMHNRGIMKDMDSWNQGGANNLRANSGKLRKILTTQNMDPNEEYYVRIKLVLDNPQAEFPINYFELCPKSVYAGAVAEDTH